MPVCQSSISIMLVFYELHWACNSYGFIFHNNLIEANLELLCWSEEFSNLSEKGFLFNFISWIHAGIWTTWPSARLNFEGNEEKLQFDFYV